MMEYLPASDVATSEEVKAAIEARRQDEAATEELQAAMGQVQAVRWLHCTASPILELMYGLYWIADHIADAYIAVLKVAIDRYAPTRGS